MDGVRIAVLVVAFLGVAGAASRGWGRRVAPLLLTLLAVEALATVAVAWLSPPLHAHTRDDETPHRPPVRLQAAGGRVWFLPGELLPPEPQVADRRVLFIGDSFTYGQGVGADTRFPAQVIDGLTARGESVEGVYHGLSGTSMYDHDALVGGYSTAISEPDLVLWTFVLNDLGGGTAEAVGAALGLQDDLIGDRRWRAGTPSRALDLALGARAAWATAAATEESYRVSFRGDARARMEALLRPHAEAMRARGGRLVLVIFPLLHALDDYPFVEAHEAIAAAARAAGADVIDLLPAFVGRDERSLWVSNADHHPNGEGHRIAAEAILAALGPVPDAGPLDCTRADSVRGRAEAALCEAPRDPAALLGWGRYWVGAPRPPGPLGVSDLATVAAAAALAVDPSQEEAARELLDAIP